MNLYSYVLIMILQVQCWKTIIFTLLRHHLQQNKCYYPKCNIVKGAKSNAPSKWANEHHLGIIYFAGDGTRTSASAQNMYSYF